MTEKELEVLQFAQDFAAKMNWNFIINRVRITQMTRYKGLCTHDGEEFYIVLSGDFCVVKALPSGKNKIIAKLHPGDTFGEMSFLDSRPRAASVIADGPGMLLKFERASLLKIPETAAKIYFNLASLMASRIRDTNSLISLALEGRESGLEQGVPPEALVTHRDIRRNT